MMEATILTAADPEALGPLESSDAGTSYSPEQVQRIQAAEAILGYHFKNPALLLQALTHPSAAESDPIHSSYERLEFLGDSLLGAVVARFIYERFGNYDEGGLTKIKITLVSGGALSKCARELGLGELIIFGSSERGTGGRGLTSALENVYEALIAALYLDGGQEVIESWVARTLYNQLNMSVTANPENPKSRLQELLQERHITPTYELVSTEGPAHARTFRVQVKAEGRAIGEGSGHSKKDAETKAATNALADIAAATPEGGVPVACI